MSSHLPCFDALRRMAREDPAGLEALRKRLVAEVIDGAGPEQRRRLEGLQFRIDAERRCAKNPLAATIRLSALMRDSLLKLQQAIERPQHGRTATPPKAVVLTFPGAKGTHERDASARR